MQFQRRFKTTEKRNLSGFLIVLTHRLQQLAAIHSSASFLMSLGNPEIGSPVIMTVPPISGVGFVLVRATRLTPIPSWVVPMIASAHAVIEWAIASVWMIHCASMQKTHAHFWAGQCASVWVTNIHFWGRPICRFWGDQCSLLGEPKSHICDDQCATFGWTNVPLSGGPMCHFWNDQCTTFGVTNAPLFGIPIYRSLVCQRCHFG